MFIRQVRVYLHKITPIMITPRVKLATEAVKILDADNSKASDIENLE